jgi:hypothetical protein
MKKLAVFTFLAVLLFIISQKVGIECKQSGFEIAGFCFIIISHILKLLFLILLILFMNKGLGRLNTGLKILLGFLCVPIFFVSCAATMISGRHILYLSRPERPAAFIKDKAAVDKLTDLANEMIQNKKTFWIGNGRDGFIFGIQYEDGKYQFDSKLITHNHDFSKPVVAEDMSEVSHPDLPVLSKGLQITDRKILDPNDYAFCKRASRISRKIGFDNIELYPEKNVVQFQIHNFIGWDNGWYNIYYFHPGDTLPEEFKYKTRLNTNWYYIIKPRFPKKK